MPGVIRKSPTDVFQCGAAPLPIVTGSGVFVNGIEVAKMGDLVGHPAGVPVPIDTSSATVFVNGIGIARAQSAKFIGDHIPGHFITPIPDPHAPSGSLGLVGSTDVFVDEGPNAALFVNTATVGQLSQNIVAPEYAELLPEVAPGATYLLSALTFTDDEESDNSQGLAVYPTPVFGSVATESYKIMSKSNGFDPDDTNYEIEELANAPSPGGIGIKPYTGDITSHSGSFPGTFQLSPNFTLSDITHCAASRFDLTAQAGLTEKQIVVNMRYLCYNILEQLLVLYPSLNWRINSGFRQFITVNESGNVSQHCLGQAVDIEFLNMTKTEKYEFARDYLQNDLNYDQLIFESRGGPSTWYHLSYNPVGTLRRKVNTSPRPKVFLSGLYRIT